MKNETFRQAGYGRRGCSRWLGDQGGFGGWKFLKSRPNKFMGGSVLGRVCFVSKFVLYLQC